MKRAIGALSLFFMAGITGFLLLGITPFPVYAQGFGNVTGGASAVDPVGVSACKSVPSEHKGDCQSCFNDGGVWTAVGCLGQGSEDNPGGKLNDFIRSFLGIGTGIGGGIAFLLILFSGFQRITSTGNPEKLHEAKDLMTAAISGLLLIIFSVFLLRLIGVNVLQIPGLE